MGGRSLVREDVKAISLVFSGTNVVLVDCAYYSLISARADRDVRLLDKRTVLSAWPIAEIMGDGMLG